MSSGLSLRERRALGNCVRCFDPTSATTQQRVTQGSDVYLLELCDTHANMLQRDLFSWTRCGTLVEDDDHATFRRPPEVGDRGTVVKAYIPVPVARGNEVIEHEQPAPQRSRLTSAQQVLAQAKGHVPLGLEEWVFTEHALDRQEARGVSRAEALFAAAEPDTSKAGKSPGTRVHYRAHVACVVNPEKRIIITVINRSLETANV